MKYFKSLVSCSTFIPSLSKNLIVAMECLGASIRDALYFNLLDITSNWSKLLCYHLKLPYLPLAYDFPKILFIIVMFGRHNLFNQICRVVLIVNVFIMLTITLVAGTSNILLVLDVAMDPDFSRGQTCLCQYHHWL